MSKFSVKKPLTVFVAVIAILVLGVVAYMKMTPDLLPNMDFPYVIVMTTYPGASPEKVEAEITKPLEQSMSTLEHIKNITSNSNENYSLVMMEFEESVNMDTIGVDIQQSITALSAGWDEMVGAPYVLKINPSMLPIEVAAVAMDGRSTVELTEFLNDTLMNKLEGIPGVARISTSGTVKQELHVILDQRKIDAQNRLIADAINKQLDEAAQNLTTQKAQLERAQAVLNGAFSQMGGSLGSMGGGLGGGMEGVSEWVEDLQGNVGEITAQLEEIFKEIQEHGAQSEALPEMLQKLRRKALDLGLTLEEMRDGVEEAVGDIGNQLTSGISAMASGLTQVAVGSTTLNLALTQMESGLSTIEGNRTTALSQADLNSLLSMDVIAGILRAQNFAMPAGYVEQDGVSYMVSVGDEIDTLEELENLLLFDLGMEGLQPIRLCDVAEVMLTDNRNESYARLDGEQGIVLTFEKQSTYSTAGATNNINDRFRELEKQYPGLHFVALMDQGDYIYMIVENILSSLLLGSVFAILILFLFLRDIRPTFITLCAIPLSVVFAIVLMYFSGVTINMISLSGLAVAVGMLVDNSVVVIENIYRLRDKGANAIQAAVSGAGQVAGAVTASTLTTVCVFLPIVFVEGITRQLFTDLALTMTYSLLASLIVSLTLVPAMASGMLRKPKKAKENGTLNKVLVQYNKLVGWALDHKFIVLAASVILLVVTGLASVAKGFIFMPKMDMPSANVSIKMPEDCTMEEATALADEVLERIKTVDGIETVGAMMGGGSILGGGMGGGSGSSSHNVTVYITLSDESASGEAVGKQIVELCQDMACEVTSSSAMMDMSMLTGSGISMELYGENMTQLQEAAKTAAETLRGLPGVAEVSDGLQNAAPALHVQVDLDNAMSKGLTVAQVFMDLSSSLSNTQSSQKLVLSGTSTDIIIERQAEERLDVEALKNHTFEVTGKDGSKQNVKLSDFAEVEETTSLNAIARKSQRRYLTVSATLEDGYNVTLLTADAQKAIDALDFGQGITYEFTGENESIMTAIEQLMLMLVLGVLLVYLVMVAQFQSLKSPFIVMFTIPLAFTGGFLALLICGMEVSVISLIGFIMLTGIIVNNGIVLVDYINQLRQEGMERREAIIEAGSTRLRPILMTSITTILGLIDMAVRTSAGTALMRPMAVVCIGGLLYATLMTLLVVPCIYDILNKKELRTVRDEDLQLLDI